MNRFFINYKPILVTIGLIKQDESYVVIYDPEEQEI